MVSEPKPASRPCRILELKPDQAQEFWPELLPYVKQALEYDPMNSVRIEDLVKQLGTGYSRVLIAERDGELMSASIAQLYLTNAGERVVHVVTTAGEQSHLWLPALRDKLQEIATQEQATSITMSGRPGWAKKLNNLGFRVAHVTMRMKVNGRSEQKQPTNKQPRIVSG